MRVYIIFIEFDNYKKGQFGLRTNYTPDNKHWETIII